MEGGVYLSGGVRAERSDQVGVREDVEGHERGRAGEYVERTANERVDIGIDVSSGVGVHIGEDGGDDAGAGGVVEDDDLAQTMDGDVDQDLIDVNRAWAVVEPSSLDVCMSICHRGGDDFTRGGMRSDLKTRVTIFGLAPARSTSADVARAGGAAHVDDTRERRAVRTAALLARREERVRDRTCTA